MWLLGILDWNECERFKSIRCHDDNDDDSTTTKEDEQQQQGIVNGPHKSVRTDFSMPNMEDVYIIHTGYFNDCPVNKLPCIEGQSVHLFSKGNGISHLFPNGINDILLACDQQYVLLTIGMSRPEYQGGLAPLLVLLLVCKCLAH